MTFAPTLVIGMGGAGLRVLKTFKEMVAEFGDATNLRSIAVDSSIEDIKKYISIDPYTTKIEMTETGFAIEDDLIPACPYLYKGIQAKGEGAVRDRVYGRFLYDIHRKEVQKTVTKYLGELRDGWQKKDGGGEKEGHLIIWIVHAIGGGTGSGSFPSLIADVNEIANQILKKRGSSFIKPYIYCIGVLPSASNIFDLSNADFNPRYFANSYAALKEIDILASPPPGLSIHPFQSEESVKITEKPFLRYFILGINEEMATTAPTVELATEMEDYLQNSNRIIANMMFTFPQQDGFENPWGNISSPYVPFSESELIIPIEKILKVAKENDRLGVILSNETKDSLKKRVLNILEQDYQNVNFPTLEKHCSAVYEAHKLRGLNYFAGILENEYRKREGDAKSQYEQRINDLWRDLGNFDWSRAQIQNLHNIDNNQKYKKIGELFVARKEENQLNLNSLVRIVRHPLQGETLRNANKNIDIILSELNVKKARWDSVTKLSEYITVNLCRDLKIAELHGKTGVPAIQQCVEERENTLKRLKEKMTVAGRGRQITLKLTNEVLDLISLSDKSRLIINPDCDISELLKKLNFSTEELTGIILGRVNHAAKGREVNIRARTRKAGDSLKQDDLFIVCNSSNYQFIDSYNSTFFSTTPTYIKSNKFDKEKFIFIHFSLGINLDDIDEYHTRQEEYQQQKLKKTAKIAGNIGTIFAYPEWFPDDEAVRKAFPKLYPE